MFPYVIHAKSIVQARGKAVNLIMNQGKYGKDQRGDKVKYIKHVLIVIPCDCCEDSPDKLTSLCDEAFANNLITGEPNGSGIQAHDYTYGEELHADEGLEKVIALLSECRVTRRAVLPYVPLFKEKHIGKEEDPCMITVVFDIEDEDSEDYVNLTILGRSNEAAIAMKSDIKGFAELLKYVAKRVDAKPGYITLHDVNLHCRINSDMDEIKRILKDGY